MQTRAQFGVPMELATQSVTLDVDVGADDVGRNDEGAVMLLQEWKCADSLSLSTEERSDDGEESRAESCHDEDQEQRSASATSDDAGNARQRCGDEDDETGNDGCGDANRWDDGMGIEHEGRGWVDDGNVFGGLGGASDGEGNVASEPGQRSAEDRIPR